MSDGHDAFERIIRRVGRDLGAGEPCLPFDRDELVKAVLRRSAAEHVSGEDLRALLAAFDALSAAAAERTRTFHDDSGAEAFLAASARQREASAVFFDLLKRLMEA